MPPAPPVITISRWSNPMTPSLAVATLGDAAEAVNGTPFPHPRPTGSRVEELWEPGSCRGKPALTGARLLAG